MTIEQLYYLPDFYHWKEKRLYKECEPENLPSARGNVQVGSLRYFREHYKDEVADKLEGKTFFKLRGLGSWAEVSSWLNNSSLGGFRGSFPGGSWPGRWPSYWPVELPVSFRTGRFSVDSDTVPGDIRFTFTLCHNPNFDLVAAECEVEYVASNAFIYCLKRSPPNDRILREYSASWTIRQEDVQKFARHLAMLLVNSCDSWSVTEAHTNETRKASEYGPWSVLPLGSTTQEANSAIIYYAVGDVLYVNSVGGIALSANYPWDWSKKLFFMSPFLKRPQYKNQDETRIVFFLVKNSGGELIGLNPVEDFVRLLLDDELRGWIRE